MKPGLVRFTEKLPGDGRVHYLRPDDVVVLLGRLPEKVWARLREVHFCDKARGNRILGYVTRGRRDITICALPSRVSLGRACQQYGLSARQFGALPRGQWPPSAIRRLLLYETFLHELGHLQVVNPRAKEPRREFAGERKAEKFANVWRKRLWSNWFEHPDPIHNAPTEEELDVLGNSIKTCPWSMPELHASPRSSSARFDSWQGHFPIDAEAVESMSRNGEIDSAPCLLAEGPRQAGLLPH